MVDSGTSIGANLEEAHAAQTRREFVNRCCISQKEARETLYWLRLAGRCYPSFAEEAAPLAREADELTAILTSIVKTARLGAFGR